MLESLAKAAGQWLEAKRWRLVTAESCTAGGVAFVITQIAGSSNWFERGFITYSNQSKRQVLGVPLSLLERDGAVSESVASAMAEGALAQSESNIALSVTGLAGPDGARPDKPVGTVCFAKATQSGVIAVTRHFTGDRCQVRYESIAFSIETLIYM